MTIFFLFSENGQIFGLEFFYRVARFFICFYFGYLISPYVKDFRKKIPSWSIVIAPPFLFALYFFIGELSHIQPILMLFIILANIAFGITISELISRTTLRKPLSSLGKYTLAIYLFHFVPNTVMHKLGMNAVLDPFIFVISTVTLAVIGSIFAYEVANKIRLGWVFKCPENFLVKRKIAI